MVYAAMICLALAGIPLARAAWANRATALAHVFLWAAAAWIAWIWCAATDALTSRYVALCLTACTGVAVLGARRPGVAAWNVVVAGLLAVLLIPVAQDFLAGTSGLADPIWLGFLGILLTVGILNYLPTRLWLCALALLIATLFELIHLRATTRSWLHIAVIGAAATALWLAWGLLAHMRQRDVGCDRLWRDFRDRFGFVWGQRLREQFNSAAHNANLPVELSWRGLKSLDGTPLNEQKLYASRDLLLALMKRFGLP